jgi:hypothetical protein
VSIVGQVVAEATSGADIAQSGTAALVFGYMLYAVFEYVAKPWVYFSDRETGRRLVMGIPAADRNGCFELGALRPRRRRRR